MTNEFPMTQSYEGVGIARQCERRLRHFGLLTLSPFAIRHSALSERTRGFTLIELMLVMALLAVVLAVSAPSLSKFFKGRTLDSEARRFVSLTRYGQSRAVSEGVPMMLWIDPKERTYGLQEETT